MINITYDAGIVLCQNVVFLCTNTYMDTLISLLHKNSYKHWENQNFACIKMGENSMKMIRARKKRKGIHK